MALLCNLKEPEWSAWVATRPLVIQEMCCAYPPNKLYRMRSTGHRVTIVSYGEDLTVRVNVTGQYNVVIFDREVFGVCVEDLEEAELPEGEMVGTVLTEQDHIDALIEKIRLEI